MKKYLLILLVLLIPSFAYSGNLIIKKVGISDCEYDLCDDFAYPDGELDANPNWLDTRRADNNDPISNALTVSSEEVVGNSNSGLGVYGLNNYALSDADYCVVIDARITPVTYLYGPCLRCFQGASGLNGYLARMDGANNIRLYRIDNGSISTLVNLPPTGSYDWTVYHKIKFCVTGSDFSLEIDDVVQTNIIATDSTYPAAGNAGIYDYGYSGNTKNYDNFAIDESP